MKKIGVMFVTILVLALFFPVIVSANMAAPAESDIASAITFEKNDTISVLSEVLDITVTGSVADIVATYKMKNTANDSVSTPSMFLSPNIENSNVKVVVNHKTASFTVDSYALHYDTTVETDDWRYAVLTQNEIIDDHAGQTVDAITFQMDFAPHEEYDVVVSYKYKLGGYPDNNFNAKNGIIHYYLTPAAMWNDFTNLTIHLYLDEDLPVIESSNVEFEKVGARTYQYVSDTLPEDNLEIVIDENWYQHIFSMLRSPYLPMMLIMASPFIVTGVALVIIIVWFVQKKKKQAR